MNQLEGFVTHHGEQDREDGDVDGGVKKGRVETPDVDDIDLEQGSEEERYGVDDQKNTDQRSGWSMSHPANGTSREQ